MTLKKPVRSPRILMQIGYVFLILASLTRWMLHPGPGLPQNLVDGITGLMYGVAIGALLMGLWKKRRHEKAQPN